VLVVQSESPRRVALFVIVECYGRVLTRRGGGVRVVTCRDGGGGDVLSLNDGHLGPYVRIG